MLSSWLRLWQPGVALCLLLLSSASLMAQAGFRSQNTPVTTAPSDAAQGHAAVQSPAAAPKAVPEELTRARLDAAVLAYDLSIKLEPESSGISALARLTIRNDGKEPLRQLALQISSTLHWDEVSSEGAKLRFAQETIDTDADHTGQADEARIQLASPLGPGQILRLTTFYSGVLPRASGRLTRLDVPPAQVEKIEWDRVESAATYLRGFGDVLWYPVAARPALLGDGAALADEDARQKQRATETMAQLRLTMTYHGPAPGAAFFCGREGVLTTAPAGNTDGDTRTGGVATAEWPPERLGFRPMHLFVTAGTPVLAGPLKMLESSREDQQKLQSAADQVSPLLGDWLGVSPQRKLTIVVQSGESFADGAFVVAPALALSDPPVMAGALTHAWFHSPQTWLDRGVPELMSVLWIERSRGRAAAVAQLGEETHALSLAESNAPGEGGARPPLLTATDDVSLRNKSVAVLSMLRTIAGDDALKQALQRVRLDETLAQDPHGFERALEQTSGKQLGWFFDDWIDHDRGLPDLEIVNVSPRALPEQGSQAGTLVAVDVRNRGGAIADVPVTVRSGSLTATERLRVPARSSASVRILFQGNPEEVQVNDGTIPEIADSIHLRRLVAGP